MGNTNYFLLTDWAGYTCVALNEEFITRSDQEVELDTVANELIWWKCGGIEPVPKNSLTIPTSIVFFSALQSLAVYMYVTLPV